MPLHVSLRRRLPLILQVEAAECGLACLAMVASYHGHEVNMAALRRRYSISLRGTTLTHLIRTAERMDLSARAMQIDLNLLDKLRCPAILHWNLNHFVVLKAVRGRRALIHDPAAGAITLKLNEVSKHFTGVALELTPTPDFSKRKERERLPLRVLWGGQEKLSGFLTQIFLFSIALEVFAILGPFFMQVVVDRVLISNDWNLLTVLGLGFGLLAVITATVTAFRAWVILYLNMHLDYQMLARLFRHLLRLPLSYFLKRHIGDIVSRFGSMQTIQRTLTTKLIASVVDGVMAVGTFAVMLIYSIQLSSIALAIIVAYIIVRWALYRPLYAATQDHLVRQARQESNFLETVRGMQAIRLFASESLRHSEWQNLMAGTLSAQVRVTKFSIFSTLANGLVVGLGHVAIIWLGAISIMNGSLTVGMLFAFVAFTIQFTGKAVDLIENGINIRLLTLHSERVADIALSEPEVMEETLAIGQGNFTGAVEIRDLAYRYGEGEKAVFSGVCFAIEAGESVAITGPSGIGKSTLVKLMLGLMKPSEGYILVDGVVLDRFGLTDYRNLVGAVLQNDRLFTGSIAENISFFEPNADIARIEKCAKLAEIHEEILNMPMGYRSLIGDMGTVLSGGQQQRVLIARALYRKPKVLFLDEATSYLDIACEEKINRSIEALKITRVIVAHRPETLRYTDRVLALTVNGISECERLQGD